MRPLSLVYAFLLPSLTMRLFAAVPESSPNFTPVEGCAAELRGNRPKIYIASFFVTYGKPDIGKAIGDYLAEKFEANGRLEVISRSEIDAEMQPLLRDKRLKVERYLEQTLAFATARKADCLIFGKIDRDKKSKRVTFMVRMADVTTGNNLLKVDNEVEREGAMDFFEKTGNSLVEYFVTAPPPAVVPVVEPTPKKNHWHIAFNTVGVLPFGSFFDQFSHILGANAELAWHAARKNFFLGIQADYQHFYRAEKSTAPTIQGIAPIALAGIELINTDTANLYAVFYAGYQFHRLLGTPESFGYGLLMTGLRSVHEITPNVGFITEWRYALALADKAQFSSFAITLGGLWRF